MLEYLRGIYEEPQRAVLGAETGDGPMKHLCQRGDPLLSILAQQDLIFLLRESQLTE